MRNIILDKFAANFIKKHFDELNLEKLEWDVKTVNDATRDIKKYDYMSSWIITEVMAWGTQTDYIEQHTLDNEEERFLIKIGRTYFAVDFDNVGYLKEVRLKYKKVAYFE